MFRFLQIAFAIALSTTLPAQNSYKAGYIIDLAGQRSEVDIYDKDWVSNPEYFQYRTSAGEVQQGDPRSVQEFGYLDGSLRYRLFTIDVDQSSGRIKTMSASPVPVYRAMTVYLECLVDGEADLFFWKQGELERYFLRIGEEIPEQLISREYLKGKIIIDNTNQYRAKLLSTLDCGIDRQDVLLTGYERLPLMAIVQRYNACRSGVPVAQLATRMPQTDHFSFALRVGSERVAGQLFGRQSSGRLRTFDLSPRYVPRLGLELESLLPFANNRWALFLESYYHRFNQRADAQAGRAGMDYQAVNLLAGARRYLYFSERTALSLSLAGVFNLPLKGSLAQFPDGTSGQLYEEVAYRNLYLQFGLGINFHKRYLLEFRIGERQNLLADDHSAFSLLRFMSFSAGYRFN